MSAETTDEKRRDAAGGRVPIRLDVRCESDNPAGNRRYVTLNLGRGGVFLKTFFPLPVDTELECTIRLPDDEEMPVEARARVKWIRPRADGIEKPSGMGIEFVDLAPSDVERLAEFVADQGGDDAVAVPEPPEAAPAD